MPTPGAPPPDARSSPLATAGHGPTAEVRAVVAAWATEQYRDSTRARLGELATRFAARLAATGVTSLAEATEADCDGFIWAPTRRNKPPSLHTVHLRRTALRAIYRTLEHLAPGTEDPTRHLTLPTKTSTRARAVTDDELALVRTAALGRTRQPLRAAAAIALAEATATTGEIPRLRWADLDLDTATLDLPGAEPIRPRTGTLTSWGHATLKRLHATTAPGAEHPVISRRPGAATGQPAQAATANQLTKILHAAGLRHPRIRPGSIRLWAGEHTRRHHGIEAAARALGIDSLDATAAALYHHWQGYR